MTFKTFNINLDEILKGKKTAVAQALNMLENNRPSMLTHRMRLVEMLSVNAKSKRHVIGLTGPPGAGKSTLISLIIKEYRDQGKSVGIIAIDPSSKNSGGSLLGDRTRISYDPKDDNIFIRSMAAGNHLGGLAGKTRQCLALFEAIYDRIIIETVGVGQSETEIEDVADTIVSVIQPGSGDVLQFIKAGIMEIPHILVVNKADQKSIAEKCINDLQAVSLMCNVAEKAWDIVLTTASAKQGRGHKELVAAIEKHCRFLHENIDIEAKRLQKSVKWAYMLFKERYGSFGVEVLDGEERILQFLETVTTINPWKAMQSLTDKMQKNYGSRL